jgi:hypothetical protein
MRARYDHFHMKFKLPDGSEDEIEGGFTGYPNDWEQLTQEQKNAWRVATAIDWGMPSNATPTAFWLAG